MKKILTALLMAVLFIGSVNAMPSTTTVEAAAPWPKIRINWHLTVMINMHNYFSNCEYGDGFCFFVGFSQVADPVKMMSAEVGPTSDGRYMAVKVTQESLQIYEDGNFLSQFDNKRSLLIKDEIHIPDEVWKKAGMEPIVYNSGTYNLVFQEGAYYVMFPLQ